MTVAPLTLLAPGPHCQLSGAGSSLLGVVDLCWTRARGSLSRTGGGMARSKTGKKDTLKPLGVPGPGSLISPSSPLPSARVAVELSDSNRSCQTRSDLSPGQSTPLAVGLQAPPPCGLCARLRHADKRCRTHSTRKII